MKNRKQILRIRLSIIFVKEKFTFINTLNEFKSKLAILFREDYSLDEIETALNELEEEHLSTYEEQGVIEFPEDFELK